MALRWRTRGIAWLEEPIRHDNYRGNAEIAQRLRVPLQIGENFNGPEAMADALALYACDYVMPDVTRIGGVSGWMHAAGIAAAHGIEMSSHLMPELSVHLLSATPTAHWLAYVDWADATLEEPLQVTDGAVIAPDRPGLGIAWTSYADWRPSDCLPTKARPQAAALRAPALDGSDLPTSST